MELEASQTPHVMIYVDEAGFNLGKRRRCGQNITGKRATVDAPGQRGANITMCAAISENGLVLHTCRIGPYNTERLLLFLEELYRRLVPEGERGQELIHTVPGLKCDEIKLGVITSRVLPGTPM
ncbi:hypothetical protein SKAU_G00359140 [Synaphobranchus kaupii]|uniref:Tc1-like transposase DDE domain-containing protein n=1 Tax=Synaphobranchus kaupii TaxID=118154 RepID=A0A9Q1EHZ8_SYNKA|nr:hypothetical protein SKAU_G00359140 [Synaphobranchus kaupii]